MLRAKDDNSAANKAESEREPIQTSVYRGEKKTTEKKGKKKPKGSNSSQQQLHQTIEQQTIIWRQAERKKNLFIRGLLNQFHRLKLIPVNNAVCNYKGWTYSRCQIIAPVRSPGEQKASFLCLVMMHFAATNQSS